ncbi:MAG TPA: endonuclease domain-containing protein, partial [Anaerolineales bacterium]
MKNNYPRLQDNPQLRRRMTEIARDFRKEPTKSEAKLWQALRGKKLDGIKFRRQQPVGPFIVDFYNSVYRLVIEIDGSIHDSQFEADKNRQNILEELG